MHTNSDEKVFYMNNHVLKKLHPNLNGGTPLNIFTIPKNLAKKKLRGFQDLEAKKFKLTSGAPWMWCATSNRKKVGFEFFLIFFQKMIRNMTGKFVLKIEEDSLFCSSTTAI